MSAMLELEGVSAWYGDARALRGVSLAVREGGITALIGANGAGKTTTLRAVCGVPRVEGSIRFLGERIDGLPTARIARKGVGHVPEGRGTFAWLTVEENLALGGIARRDRRQCKADLARLFERFPALAERRRQQAGSLSGGEQQMLAIARALMLRPRLLALDEPSFGLAPRMVETIFRILREINRAEGMGMLLVEQNAKLALELATDACLLEAGRVVIAGPASDIRHDPRVRLAYLGG